MKVNDPAETINDILSDRLVPTDLKDKFIEIRESSRRAFWIK